MQQFTIVFFVLVNTVAELGYSAFRGKNFFASPPTKIAEFKAKNRRKRAEEAKAEILLLLLLL